MACKVMVGNRYKSWIMKYNHKFMCQQQEHIAALLLCIRPSCPSPKKLSSSCPMKESTQGLPHLAERSPCIEVHLRYKWRPHTIYIGHAGVCADLQRHVHDAAYVQAQRWKA
eukprot:1160456-Pelagomonas_calceolata.AAC.13